MRTSAAVYGTLAAIVLLAGLVRLRPLVLHRMPAGDEGIYLEMAVNVAKGKELLGKTMPFATADGITILHDKFRLFLLFPVLGSFILRMGGEPFRSLQVFNLLLSLINIALLFLWVRRLWSRNAALLAAFLLAVDVVSMSSNAYIGTDTLFQTCMLLLSLWVLWLRQSSNGILFLFLGGLLLGLAYFARTNGLLLIPGILVSLFPVWRKQPSHVRIQWASAFVVGFGIILLPKFVAHYSETGKVVSSLMGGYNIPDAPSEQTQGEGSEIRDRAAGDAPVPRVKSCSEFGKITARGKKGIQAFFAFCKGTFDSDPLMAGYWAIGILGMLGLAVLRGLWFEHISAFLLFAFLSLFKWNTPYIRFLYVLWPYFIACAAVTLTFLIKNLSDSGRVPKKVLAAALLAAVCLPLVEPLYNYVHPVLARKFDEREEYAAYHKLGAFIESETGEDEAVIAWPKLNQLVYEFQRKTYVPAPKSMDTLLHVFANGPYTFLALSREVLTSKDPYFQRPGLREWCDYEEGRWKVKTVPLGLRVLEQNPYYILFGKSRGDEEGGLKESVEAGK